MHDFYTQSIFLFFYFCTTQFILTGAELDKMAHSLCAEMEAAIQNDNGIEQVQQRLESSTMLLITVKVVICIQYAHKLHHR